MPNKNNISIDTNKLLFDTSLIAILPYDTTDHWFFETGRPAILTNRELEIIETVLAKCVQDHNPQQEKRSHESNNKHPEYNPREEYFNIDLSRYKRQYVAVVNSRGEKEVWVNFFCNSGGDNWKKEWKKEIINVDDGGSCFFNLKINLATGEYYDFRVNAVV